MSDSFEYICSCCGERHTGLPELAFDSPLHYYWLTADERAAAFLNSDICSIGDDRFVRGVLEIPIIGSPTPFSYGVWVSLSAKNFRAYIELDQAGANLPDERWFGWLCNRLPGYPDTLNLKTNVVPQPHPLRPTIELEPTDHPLAIEQSKGISLARWREICEANLHQT